MKTFSQFTKHISDRPAFNDPRLKFNWDKDAIRREKRNTLFGSLMKSVIGAINQIN